MRRTPKHFVLVHSLRRVFMREEEEGKGGKMRYMQDVGMCCCRLTRCVPSPSFVFWSCGRQEQCCSSKALLLFVIVKRVQCFFFFVRIVPRIIRRKVRQVHKMVDHFTYMFFFFLDDFYLVKKNTSRTWRKGCTERFFHAMGSS